MLLVDDKRRLRGDDETVSYYSDSLSSSLSSYSILSLSQNAKHLPCVELSDIYDVQCYAEGSNCDILSGTFMETDVVIKLMKESRICDEVVAKEFDDERSILSQCRHPSIVSLSAYGVSPRRFLVLEKLRSFKLAHINDLRDKNKVSIQCLIYARELISAIEYLHNGFHSDFMVIHRDLKPDNICLSDDGVLKLIDFGLALCVRKRSSPYERYNLTGNTGSARYMAPEVFLSQPYNELVDVYSFGIIFWQMITGKTPFDGMNIKAYWQRVILEGERPPLNPRWPERITALLGRCWDTNPSNRPTAKEIGVTLDELIAKQTTKGSLFTRFKNSFIL